MHEETRLRNATGLLIHPLTWLTGALGSCVALSAGVVLLLLGGLELPEWLAFASVHLLVVLAYLWGWLLSRRSTRKGGAALLLTPLERTNPFVWHALVVLGLLGLWGAIALLSGLQPTSVVGDLPPLPPSPGERGPAPAFPLSPLVLATSIVLAVLAAFGQLATVVLNIFLGATEEGFFGQRLATWLEGKDDR